MSSKIKNIFRHLKLEIASVFQLQMNEKYNRNNSAAQYLGFASSFDLYGSVVRWIGVCVNINRYDSPYMNIENMTLHRMYGYSRCMTSLYVLLLTYNNGSLITFSLPYMTEISVVIRQWT